MRKKTPKIASFPWDFVTLTKEDRATAIGNMHKNGKHISRMWFRRYARLQTHRQTDTHTQTCASQYFASDPASEVKISIGIGGTSSALQRRRYNQAIWQCFDYRRQAVHLSNSIDVRHHVSLWSSEMESIQHEFWRQLLSNAVSCCTPKWGRSSVRRWHYSCDLCRIASSDYLLLLG